MGRKPQRKKTRILKPERRDVSSRPETEHVASGAWSYPRGEAPQGRLFLALGLVALAVCLSYANSLRNDFVHDDRLEILDNPFIQDLSNWNKILTSSSWAFRSNDTQQSGSNYYRPVQYLMYAGLYHFFGPSPLAFHLAKLALHLLVCLFFFWAVFRYLGNYALALISSLIFAVHPANTEAVTWVAGITDVTCALCFVAAILFYWKSRSGKETRISLSGMVICFFLGLLCKETMVTFVPVLFLFEWLQTRAFPSGRRILSVYAPLLVAFLLYLSLRLNAIGGFTNPLQLRYDYLNPFQGLLNQAELLAKYFVTFFLPISLNAYHLFFPIVSVADVRVLLAVMTLAVVLMGFWYFSRKFVHAQRALVVWGVAWFCVSLSLVLLFYKRLGENVFAERYLYLPSLGLSLSVSVLLVQLKRRNLYLTLAVLLTVLLSLAWMTVRRNRVWKDELTFCEATVKASPRSARMYNNLGLAYASRRRYADAARAFESSIANEPIVEACYNLGQIYGVLHRFDEASASYQKAASLSPGDPKIYSALGDLYFAQRFYPKAIDAYQQALELQPSESRTLFNLADACFFEKRYPEALIAYQRILDANPTEAGRAYQGMASVYSAQNLPEQAAWAAGKAKEILP